MSFEQRRSSVDGFFGSPRFGLVGQVGGNNNRDASSLKYVGESRNVDVATAATATATGVVAAVIDRGVESTVDNETEKKVETQFDPDEKAARSNDANSIKVEENETGAAARGLDVVATEELVAEFRGCCGDCLDGLCGDSSSGDGGRCAWGVAEEVRIRQEAGEELGESASAAKVRMFRMKRNGKAGEEAGEKGGLGRHL